MLQRRKRSLGGKLGAIGRSASFGRSKGGRSSVGGPQALFSKRSQSSDRLNKLSGAGRERSPLRADQPSPRGGSSGLGLGSVGGGESPPLSRSSSSGGSAADDVDALLSPRRGPGGADHDAAKLLAKLGILDLALGQFPCKNTSDKKPVRGTLYVCEVGILPSDTRHVAC